MTKPPTARIVFPQEYSGPTASEASANTTTLVLGLSPAHSAGLVYHQAGLAAGLSMLNAVHSQHSQFATNLAVGVMGVDRLYRMNSRERSSKRLEKKFDNLTNLLNRLSSIDK